MIAIGISGGTEIPASYKIVGHDAADLRFDFRGGLKSFDELLSTSCVKFGKFGNIFLVNFINFFSFLFTF